MITTITQLISAIAAREGKKSQASVGDIREITAIIADVVANDRHAEEAWNKYVNRKRKPSKAFKRHNV